MKKRIKNKAVRKVLRTIANWDNCPMDYRRNWNGYFATIAAGLLLGLFGVVFLGLLVVLFM